MGKLIFEGREDKLEIINTRMRLMISRYGLKCTFIKGDIEVDESELSQEINEIVKDYPVLKGQLDTSQEEPLKVKGELEELKKSTEINVEVEPIDPVEAINTIDAVDPVNPIDPIDPIDPVEPNKPKKVVEDVKPKKRGPKPKNNK